MSFARPLQRHRVESSHHCGIGWLFPLYPNLLFLYFVSGFGTLFGPIYCFFGFLVCDRWEKSRDLAVVKRSESPLPTQTQHKLLFDHLFYKNKKNLQLENDLVPHSSHNIRCGPTVLTSIGIEVIFITHFCLINQRCTVFIAGFFSSNHNHRRKIFRQVFPLLPFSNAIKFCYHYYRYIMREGFIRIGIALFS